MTKSITFGTIICLLTVFLTLSFKPAENGKKEYVTISYDAGNKDVSLAYSNGTYKQITYQKSQGRGDNTQILNLINEQEALGYKLISLDSEFPAGASTYISTALLSK